MAVPGDLSALTSEAKLKPSEMVVELRCEQIMDWLLSSSFPLELIAIPLSVKAAIVS